MTEQDAEIAAVQVFNASFNATIAEVDQRPDAWPMIVIGIWALLETTWIIISMFVCTTPSGCTAPYLRVFGDNSANIAYGITASWINAAYFSGWIIYTLVSFVQFIAWILAIVGVNVSFFQAWTSFVGLWGHAILLIVPWTCVVLNMLLITGWITTDDDSVFLLIVNAIFWIAGTLLHVFLVPLIEEWAKATTVFKPYDPDCKCDKCVISKYVAPSDIPRALVACTDNCEVQCPPKQCAKSDQECLKTEWTRKAERQEKLRQIQKQDQQREAELALAAKEAAEAGREASYGEISTADEGDEDDTDPTEPADSDEIEW